jgi:hypothetical protein
MIERSHQFSGRFPGGRMGRERAAWTEKPHGGERRGEKTRAFLPIFGRIHPSQQEGPSAGVCPWHLKMHA